MRFIYERIEIQKFLSAIFRIFLNFIATLLILPIYKTIFTIFLFCLRNYYGFYSLATDRRTCEYEYLK